MEILLYDKDIKMLKKEIKQSKKYIKKNKKIPTEILNKIFVVVYDDAKEKFKITIPYLILYQFSKLPYEKFIILMNENLGKISYNEFETANDIISFEDYKKYLKNHPVVLDFENSIELLLLLFNVDKNIYKFSKRINKFIEICSLSELEGIDEELLNYEKQYFFKNYMYNERMLN